MDSPYINTRKVFMKKFIAAIIFAACLAIPALAQDAEKPVWDHGDNVSEYNYYSTPIYSIMQTKDAYIVFYQQQSLSVASVVIPKDWQKLAENKKLFFRNKAAGLDSYMTAFYKNGEFHHVILTVTSDRRDPIWTVAPVSIASKISAEGIDTFDVKF